MAAQLSATLLIYLVHIQELFFCVVKMQFAQESTSSFLNETRIDVHLWDLFHLLQQL